MKKTFTRIKRNWLWLAIRFVFFVPSIAVVGLGAIAAFIYGWIDKTLPEGISKEEIPLNKMNKRELKRYHSFKALNRTKNQQPIYTIEKEFLPSGHIKYVFKRLKDN